MEYIKKNYPNIKIVQWFLDRMDSNWINNKRRFLDKIDLMDISFCTTDPISLNFNGSISLKKLKILHVTNFNERHNGRLFYNTGKRINNGLIRLNHSVLEFSDRDIVSYYRNLNDLTGSKRLNKKLLEVISNYVPDILILGHADLIKRNFGVY